MGRWYITLLNFGLLGLVSGCDGTFLMHKASCKNGQVQKGTLCVDPTKEGLEGCVDPDLALVSDKAAITLCDGTIAKGTLKMPANCNGDGQTNCLITGNQVWIDKSKLSASTPNCTSDGQTGCITTSTLKAADTSTISAYDLRFGKTLAGITGQRKTCRNGMNTSTGPALYNYDGNTSAIGTGAQTGGTNGDWWDTIDDYNNNLGTATFGPIMGSTPAWSSEYYCDGSQITEVTNNESWLVPSGVKINCDSGGCGPSAQNFTFTQIFQDGYTGLYITNVLATSSSTVNWAEAIHACNNIQSGDGTGRWRLPTQKELMDFYVGGIYLQNSAKFAGRLTDDFWSASGFSGITSIAWAISLYDGLTFNGNFKNSNFAVLCVR